MRKVVAFILWCCLSVVPAAAQLTQAGVNTTINADILSCGDQCVTSAILRSVLLQMNQATFQFTQFPNSYSALQTFQAGIVANAQSINVTANGCTNSPGIRAPFYICNDATTNLLGQSVGMQIWIGNNPTGTPGVGNNIIALTGYINNLNNRGAGAAGGVWFENLICQQGTVAAGGASTIIRCNETDVNESITVSNPLSAFSSGPAVYGAQYVSSSNGSGTIFPVLAAITITSAGDVSSSQEWFNFGVGGQRIHLALADCELASGDVTAAFTKGCLWDQSNSTNVILVAGSHTTFADVSGATLTELINCGTHLCSFAGSGGAGTTGGYLSATGAGAAFPSVTNSFAASWNFTQGSGEVDFWNTFQPTSQSAGFTFYQQTGASANTLLATLDKTGAFTATAGIKATGYTVGSTAGASCTLTTVSHLTVVNGLVTLCN